MKLKNLSLLLSAGTAFAHPPPPQPYVPPPTFIDLDDDVINNDVVLETALNGIWETNTNAPPLKFEKDIPNLACAFWRTPFARSY
jgi:hypothetical protein